MNTVVKANSLLGFGVKHSGSRVTFTAATRAWNNAVEKYQGWGSRGVYIQKLASNGTWRNVGGLTTNSGGNATKVLSTGAGGRGSRVVCAFADRERVSRGSGT